MLRRGMSCARTVLLMLALGLGASPVWAQGQDSSPGARHTLILAEWLPGYFDNVNQYYFDIRRGLPESVRHPRRAVAIESVAAPALGPRVFLLTVRDGAGEGAVVERLLLALEPAARPDAVRLRQYAGLPDDATPTSLQALQPADLMHDATCDLLLVRRAGHYRSEERSTDCAAGPDRAVAVLVDAIELSAEDLFLTLSTPEARQAVSAPDPLWLERARTFHCYVDIPGVGGGRDIPFERYDGIILHDKGGAHWFTTREPAPRTFGISLQSVTWHVLNESNGNFNRDSLVLYVRERLADGAVQEHGYAFTDVSASRIGHNLKWLLANCAMTPRDQVRPEM